MKSKLSCFINKMTLFMILLQFLPILFPCKLCVAEKKRYVNKGYNLLNPYRLTDWLSMTFNRLPWTRAVTLRIPMQTN
jgi:hypothetical protein